MENGLGHRKKPSGGNRSAIIERLDNRVFASDQWHELVAYMIWKGSEDTHRAFVFSYRLYTQPEDLCAYLFEVVARPFKEIEFDESFEANSIRESVLMFFRFWLELSFRDWNNAMLTSFLEKLEGIVSPTESNAFKLLALKRANFEPLVTSEAVPLAEDEFLPLMEQGDVGTVAQQAAALMAVDKMLFLEMTGQGLLLSDSTSMHHHFNRICFWTSSKLLSIPDRPGQIAAMTRLIVVAAEAFNEGSCLGPLAIAAGLTCFDVSRLRIDSALPDVYKATLEEFEAMLTGKDNYKILRGLEQTLAPGQQFVPFVPMHLRDFVAVKENLRSATFRDLEAIGKAVCNLLSLQPRIKAPSNLFLKSRDVELWLNVKFYSDERRARLSDELKAKLSGTDVVKSPRSPKRKTQTLLTRNKPMKKSLSRQSGILAMNRTNSVVNMADLDASLKKQAEKQVEKNEKIAAAEKNKEVRNGGVMQEQREDSQHVYNKKAAKIGEKRIWARRYGIKFNEKTRHGALVVWNGSSSKAERSLGYLAGYFRSMGTPRVVLNQNMMDMATALKVLFFDPNQLRDAQGRAVLFMRPALYFPDQIPDVDVVRLLMAFGQAMFAQEKCYVFIADMRDWGRKNFSVKYAKDWFFAMQALPLPIEQFVLVCPAPFFFSSFRLFSPVLKKGFREKWKLLDKLERLGQEILSPESVPSVFGGPVVLDYEKSLGNLVGVLNDVRDTSGYWDTFDLKLPELLPVFCCKCSARVNAQKPSTCFDCKRIFCTDCVTEGANLCASCGVKKRQRKRAVGEYAKSTSESEDPFVEASVEILPKRRSERTDSRAGDFTMDHLVRGTARTANDSVEEDDSDVVILREIYEEQLQDSDRSVNL